MRLVDLIGFAALGMALIAMSKKNVIMLRRWHLAASFLYLIYGLLIMAYPIILGAVLYCSIHLYHLYKNRQLTR